MLPQWCGRPERKRCAQPLIRSWRGNVTNGSFPKPFLVEHWTRLVLGDICAQTCGSCLRATSGPGFAPPTEVAGTTRLPAANASDMGFLWYIGIADPALLPTQPPSPAPPPPPDEPIDDTPGGSTVNTPRPAARDRAPASVECARAGARCSTAHAHDGG